jgi:hypothetical protein
MMGWMAPERHLGAAGPYGPISYGMRNRRVQHCSTRRRRPKSTVTMLPTASYRGIRLVLLAR